MVLMAGLEATGVSPTDPGVSDPLDNRKMTAVLLLLGNKGTGAEENEARSEKILQQAMVMKTKRGAGKSLTGRSGDQLYFHK